MLVFLCEAVVFLTEAGSESGKLCGSLAVGFLQQSSPGSVQLMHDGGLDTGRNLVTKFRAQHDVRLLQCTGEGEYDIERLNVMQGFIGSFKDFRSDIVRGFEAESVDIGHQLNKARHIIAGQCHLGSPCQIAEAGFEAGFLTSSGGESEALRIAELGSQFRAENISGGIHCVFQLQWPWSGSGRFQHSRFAQQSGVAGDIAEHCLPRDQIPIDGHVTGKAEFASVKRGTQADGQYGPRAAGVAGRLYLLRQFRLITAEQFEPREHLLNSQVDIASQECL